MPLNDKKSFYKKIKIAGMLSYLPIVLLSGTFAGYFGGIYLEEKFKPGFPLAGICLGIGIGASVFEALRIIKRVIKLEKEP